MRLRYQLFLISLCLLILPWGAWQYLKAVDIALRESQTQSLIDNASLIADRLSLEPQLFDDFFVTSAVNKSRSVASQQDLIDKNNDALQKHRSLYAFPLSSIPIIDGYGDEWRDSRAEKIYLSKESSSAQLQVGAYQEKFYFYFSIKDQHLQYYNPLSANNEDNEISVLEDHILLKVFNGKGQVRDYFIRTSAPSRIVAHFYDDEGRLRRQDAIRGVWKENVGGYQLELAVEKSLLKQGFLLSVVDKQKDGVNVMTLSHHENYLTTPSQAIEEFIQVFRSPSLAVKVLNPDQWLVAMINAQETSMQKSSLVKSTLPSSPSSKNTSLNSHVPKKNTLGD